VGGAVRRSLEERGSAAYEACLGALKKKFPTEKRVRKKRGFAGIRIPHRWMLAQEGKEI